MFRFTSEEMSQNVLSEPRRHGALILLPLILSACADLPHHSVKSPHTGQVAVMPSPHASPDRLPPEDTPVLDLHTATSLEGIIPVLADKRVVLVGETHDRYDNHLMQLEIIRRLHAVHPKLAIGMEMFQQPFQSVLDDYIAGRVDEKQLLRDTEYYRRWRFDFRLYAPILEYAREQKIPVIALNVPVELTSKVAREGLAGLTEAERRQVPAEIDRSDAAYEARLREIYRRHPRADGHGFSDFVDVQLLWDEGMAERAAQYLRDHPDEMLVVLAGSGHLAYGSGIPQRLSRRVEATSAIVLSDWEGVLEPGLADYLLLPREQALPPSGKFGALLDEQEDVLRIDKCLPDSPCQRAGLREGDQIVAINGESITDLADLRVATWDQRPGDSVTVQVRRQRWFRAPEDLSLEVVLR